MFWPIFEAPSICRDTNHIMKCVATQNMHNGQAGKRTESDNSKLNYRLLCQAGGCNWLWVLVATLHLHIDFSRDELGIALADKRHERVRQSFPSLAYEFLGPFSVPSMNLHGSQAYAL